MKELKPTTAPDTHDEKKVLVEKNQDRFIKVLRKLVGKEINLEDAKQAIQVD
jgi:hypothetical protein